MGREMDLRCGGRWWEVEKVRRCVEVEGSCVASFPKEGNNVLDEYLSILTLFKSTFLI